jgi:hypothetical protein
VTRRIILVRKIQPEEPVSKKRYRVVFTPVGWQVIDTIEARDPVGEYGLGAKGHELAKALAHELNEDAKP